MDSWDGRFFLPSQHITIEAAKRPDTIHILYYFYNPNVRIYQVILISMQGVLDSYVGAVQGPVVQQLLTLMDGKDALNGVVVIAATNRPDQLDAAILRPGRFDRLIYVPLPDEESRRSQWKLHLAGKPGAETIDYEKITAASAGYTGAEIQHIVNKVAMESLKAAMNGEAGKSLTNSDILDAIRITPAQVSPEQVAAYDAIATRLSR